LQFPAAMPGKSEMAKSEVAAVSHRELRRSEPMLASRLGDARGKFPRASMQSGSGSENVTAPNGARRSPRGVNAGAGKAMTQPRLTRTTAAARVSGALNDITNVSASRALQAYGKAAKQAGAGQATVSAPLAPPVAAFGNRPLTPRGDEVQIPLPQVVATVGQQASMLDASPFQGDGENPQLVHEYAADIFGQLFRDEAAQRQQTTWAYMEKQTDINGRMRAILIDWLIEVHMKYRLVPETLFLTVNLIDRYLSRTHVMRKKLQLVGVAAMFIAAKFEEIHPPEVQDFVHITDNAYKKDDVLTMELEMLTTLSFKIVVPTAAHFLDRLQRVNRCDEVHREVAEYLLELGLLDMQMLRFPPSHITSAALLLSNELMGRRGAEMWPQHMVQHSRHTEQVLRVCAEEYRELLNAAPKAQLQAVTKKFSMPQRQKVARMNF